MSLRNSFNVSDAVFAPSNEAKDISILRANAEKQALRGDLWQDAYEENKETSTRCMQEVKDDFESMKDQLRQAYTTKEKQLRTQYDLDIRKWEMELRTEQAKRMEAEHEAAAARKLLDKTSALEDEKSRLKQKEEIDMLNQEVETLKTKITHTNTESTSAADRIAQQDLAIKTASVTLQSQSEYINELDGKVEQLTKELSKATTAQTQQESDSTRIGVLEARVVSLMAQLDDRNEEIKRMQKTRDSEVHQLDTLLKQEAERSTMTTKEHLKTVKNVEQTANQEVIKLQGVVKTLLQQQKQRESLCDALKSQLNERDVHITELRSQLNNTTTKDESTLAAQREIWHSERLRLESEVKEKSVAFNTLKQGLSSMISQLEERLAADATSRSEERQCWQARVENLENALREVQVSKKMLDTTAVSKHPSLPLDTSGISVQCEGPENGSFVAKENMLDQDILSKIESHLSKMFSMGKEPVGETRLQSELEEKKLQMDHLSKKYKAAKGKLARETREKEELERELTHLSVSEAERPTSKRRSSSASRAPFNTGPFSKPSPYLKGTRKHLQQMPSQQPTPSIINSKPSRSSTPVASRLAWKRSSATR